MADSVYDIVHTPKHYATQAGAIAVLTTGRWGYAEDTGVFIINYAGTPKYFYNSVKMALTTGDDVTGMTYGAGLIGSAGITGVTPRGGSSGSVGTVYDVMVGLKNYTNTSVSGTAGTIPIFSSANVIGNSIITYVNGVFDVTYPSAGSVTTWRATNTSNTAGSGASMVVGVQGASATGDAFFATQLAGTINYVFGYDVSATMFAFSAGNALGTNNVFTADGTTFTVVDLAKFNAAVTCDTTLGVTGRATFTLAPIVSAFSDRILVVNTTGLVVADSNLAFNSAASSVTIGSGNVFTLSTGAVAFTGVITMASTLGVTGTIKSNQAGGGSLSAFISSSSTPSFAWHETDMGPDGKYWDAVASSGVLDYRTVNDANNAAANYLSITRSANTITNISIANATNNPTTSFLGTGLVSVGGALKVVGAFGCNGQTAQTAYTNAANGNLTYAAGTNGYSTAAAAQELMENVIAIRAALTANGITVNGV